MMLSRLRGTLIAAGVVVVLVAAAVIVFRPPAGTEVTAYFTQSVGIFKGSDVKILGVKSGHVTSVRAEGSKVRVKLVVDHGVDVPSDAKAVAVSPSLVADRYVQLTPAYVSGPRLVSGAVIPDSRTATPLELDKVYDSIKKLANDLGPNGLNKEGALSRSIEVGAKNMNGNGRAIGQTIEDFGKAAKTLNGSQDDFFKTIQNLAKFTGMIKDNDGAVRQAQNQLAQVTEFLAADRQTLGQALSTLADALVRVEKFIKDNRDMLKKNITKLASITQTLVDQRESLAEALDNEALAAGNMLNAYDPSTGTLMGRANLNELSMPLPAAGSAATTGGKG
ncbi:mce related protein [Actinomadura rubteroloni]|uniref:Mce related protein n=1 Tax=Actinomadura rubteroloni TaxID=1926885 RepID=A0A2P4UQS2_9ACTN|nr:MCE family protein [Actinomadura rubteroloni]POM27389.1 mce related protein [Actinomadura rubteroloni]